MKIVSRRLFSLLKKKRNTERGGAIGKGRVLIVFLNFDIVG